MFDWINLGPGKYDLQKMNSGPKISIAKRDKTFDQKCNSNPGNLSRNITFMTVHVQDASTEWNIVNYCGVDIFLLLMYVKRTGQVWDSVNVWKPRSDNGTQKQDLRPKNQRKPRFEKYMNPNMICITWVLNITLRYMHTLHVGPGAYEVASEKRHGPAFTIGKRLEFYGGGFAADPGLNYTCCNLPSKRPP